MLKKLDCAWGDEFQGMRLGPQLRQKAPGVQALLWMSFNL